MSLTVPPAVNYPSPLIALPTKWWKPNPVEGAQMVPVEIDWGVMGGTSNCVSFNLQNLAPQQISQLVAISVDNSKSGGDIQVVFPDTATTYTIPAYEPASVIPVFTNQTQFFVVGMNVLSGDVTRMALLNTMPPPSSINPTQSQLSEAARIISLPVAGAPFQIIPAGTNGTLQDFQVHLSIQSAASYTYTIDLEDGTGAFLWGVDITGKTDYMGIIGDLKSVNKRFQNGLKLGVIGGGTEPTGFLSLNLYYRTP